MYKVVVSILANPLEGAAVDLLQICHICQHLVAQGAPDAGPTGKGGRVLGPVGSDEGVDARIAKR